jgi:5-methylcytosine-specific restriction endonuclease McrA
MERTFKIRSEIVSLGEQYKEKIENRKKGVRIGNKKFLCACCICGKEIVRQTSLACCCEDVFCKKVMKSYRDLNYRKSEIGQATRRKNRKTQQALETRKKYEQTEAYKKLKSERAKYYRESEHTQELDKARKLRYYYRKYSALRSIRIEGADAISFEDWKKLYSAETCYYCGKAISGRNKTVDHKTPISRGGTNKLDNLCMCCQSCNSKKNNKTEAEFKGVAI